MHALGPGANTDTKLLILWSVSKGRVLAQDGDVAELVDAQQLVLPQSSVGGCRVTGASAIKCWWLPRNPLVC